MVEEAAPFQRWARGQAHVTTLITGVGAKNAASHLSAALEQAKPEWVLTCGYAGGLDPKLQPGQVVCDCDPSSRLGQRLLQAGAREVRFLCADRIAVTAAEKRTLRLATGADVVEMESGIIRRICSERSLPSATVRVISDTAEEDLPLDFNRLLSADQRLDYSRLAGTIFRSPNTIPGLVRLRNQTKRAARELGRVLVAALSG
jgi:adenosylhomocysteine nucleosidase